MNLNNEIKSIGNKEVADCPVEQDIYTGKAKRYIVFTYEDERPNLYGNNEVIADEAYLQIAYFTPVGYDYMEDKKKIRNYLETHDFQVTSIQSWVEDILTGTSKIRHTVFEVNTTQMRTQED